MTVHEAKSVARQWVMEEGSKTPGFCGAFFHGSVNTLSEDALLAPTSDVDVMIVLSGDIPDNKLGKFVYQNVLLEVSYLPLDQVASADAVLGTYHLAGSFRVPGIIADPTGHLSEVQTVVARDFADAGWVRRRCDDAAARVVRNLDALNESLPLHNQVLLWLFASGVLTHILLVAGLQNPTVRKRYVAVKTLLSEYGFADFYETLLESLGCAGMTPAQVAAHLSPLAQAFDAAAAALRTPYPFAADLAPESRPVAIDGSRELIEQGLHREAIFWMAATYSRCITVLAVDGTEVQRERHDTEYRRLLADLGIRSLADIEARAAMVRDLLPQVRAVADEIITKNPAIRVR